MFPGRCISVPGERWLRGIMNLVLSNLIGQFKLGMVEVTIFVKINCGKSQKILNQGRKSYSTE